MTLLVLFGYLFFGGGAIDVEALGLYQPERAAVWQWGEDLLFCEYMPAKLVVVSSSGMVKASFGKEGQGPMELYRPTLMGFDDQNLYIISNRTRVVVFDKNLKIVESSLPSLQPIVGSKIVWQGVKSGENTFIMVYGSTGIQHTHGMIEAELKGQKWKITNRFYPFDIGANNKNMPLPNAKNPKWQIGGSKLFRIQSTVLQTEDQYEILFFPKPWENKAYDDPIGGLFSNVEDIVSKDKNFRCFPDRIGELPRGFVVQLSFDRTNIVHDYFDENGGFLRRDFEDYHIIPVGNVALTLRMEWKNDEEFMTKIQ